jgi:hypothetical protein
MVQMASKPGLNCCSSEGDQQQCAWIIMERALHTFVRQESRRRLPAVAVYSNSGLWALRGGNDMAPVLLEVLLAIFDSGALNITTGWFQMEKKHISHLRNNSIPTAAHSADSIKMDNRRPALHLRHQWVVETINRCPEVILAHSRSDRTSQIPRECSVGDSLSPESDISCLTYIGEYSTCEGPSGRLMFMPSSVAHVSSCV